MKIFNFFLTHILCLCLLMLSMPIPKSAYAQDASATPTPAPEVSAEGEIKYEDCDAGNSSKYNACMKRNEEIGKAAGSGSGASAISGGKHESLGDIDDVIQHSQIATMIFAFVAAIAGSLYMIPCYNVPSAWLFAATSTTWIIGEVIMWSKQDYNASRTKVRALTNVTQELIDKQILALDAAYDDTMEAYEWARVRGWLMFAVMMGYYAAGIVGIAETIASYLSVDGVSWDKCYGNWKDLTVNKKDNYDQYGPRLDGQSLYVQIYSSQKILQNHINSYRNLTVLQELEELAINNNDLAQYNHFPSWENVEEDFGNSAVATKLSEKIKSTLSLLFIKDANASGADHGWHSFVDVLLAAGIGLAAWIATITIQKATSASTLIRTAFYFGMGIVVMGAMIINDQQRDKFKKRADAYKSLKNQIIAKIGSGPDEATGSGPGDQGPGGQGPGSQRPDGQFNDSVADLRPLPDGTCVQGNLGVINGSSAGPCPCTDPKGCTKVETSKMPPMSNFGNLPTFLTQMPDSFAKASSKAANGNGSAATGILKNVATSNHNAILKKLKKDMSKKLDALVKKKSPKAKPLAELEKQMVSQLAKTISKLQASLSPSDVAKMGGLMSTPSDKIDENLKKSGFDEWVKSKSGGIAPSKMVEEEATPEDSETASDEPKAVDSVETFSAYEDSGQDILKETGVSIFEQISVRYRKSAFPIFFTKAPEAPTPTAP